MQPMGREWEARQGQGSGHDLGLLLTLTLTLTRALQRAPGSQTPRTQ